MLSETENSSDTTLMEKTINNMDYSIGIAIDTMNPSKFNGRLVLALLGCMALAAISAISNKPIIMTLFAMPLSIIE